MNDQEPDTLLQQLADYAAERHAYRREAMQMARYCLMDALGCAMQAFEAPECVAHIGPIVPGTVVPDGARVPGTRHALDPVKAAFDITCLVRWFDFNAVWFTGGSPADTLGAVLATADYVSRRNVSRGLPALAMRDVLEFLIKAYEIHGQLSTGNRFDSPEIGLDSTFIVKVAAVAVAAHILGAGRSVIVNALSQAIVDGHSLNLYRVWPHTGPRKSWAAADAASRGVRLALIALGGEPGYPRAITAPNWGFQDVLLKGKALVAPVSLGSEVVENIQFKLGFPAQRHCQSAAECAVTLHPAVRDRLGDIERVLVRTHGLAMRTVNVSGPLANYAARDHCLQYIVAVGLIYGDITVESYSDNFAKDLRIDTLRARIEVEEDTSYTRGYNDADKRSNANAVQVLFRDGTATPEVAIEHPLGDRRRRSEGLPRLEAKFERNLACRYDAAQQARVRALFADQEQLEAAPVHEVMNALAV